MIQYFFINASILISLIFIGGQIFKSINIGKESSMKVRVSLGIVYGIFGAVLLFFSIRVTQTTMLDLRHLPVIIAAIYGGAVPAFISALIICAARLAFFEFSLSTLAAIIYVLAVALGCSLISGSKLSLFRKWLFMISYSFIVVITAVIYVLEKQSVLGSSIPHLIDFAVTLFVASLITFYMSEYIRKSNMLLTQLKEQSTKDFLTGLNNVRQFDNLINKAVTDAIHTNKKLSLIIIDIDHFKNINDTYGHIGGDAILKELGKILSGSCRAMDYASRMGGEEFTILMPDCGHDQAVEAAERIRLQVQTRNFVIPGNTKINITISLGVSTYPDTINNMNDLLLQADDALYRAKRTGRNKVCSIEGCKDTHYS